MKHTRKENLFVILTILPSAAAIITFVYGFIGWTIRVSFSNWKGITPDYSFAGLKNFYNIFKSPRFLIDIANNISFSILFIAICIGGGLILAILLDQNLKGVRIFQNIYLFPLALSFVVTGIAWRWIFNPNGGVNILLNNLLTRIGIDNINIDWGWFIVPNQIGPFRLALLPVIVAASWQFMGYVMAMYLAGIRGIPAELREAARIDGATEFQIYSKVVLPLLKPVTLAALIILGHISLKVFDLIYVMTGSGPGFVTDFPSIFMYEATFKANNYSQGASIAIMMLLMVAVVIIPYLTMNLRRKAKD
ncbi:MAG: carbohydrate ABC transporter permease [Candidatus Humimicrobiaceae bacterium]